MSKRTFTPDEKVTIVKESILTGFNVTCAKHSLSKGTLSDWKGKYNEELSVPLPSVPPASVPLKAELSVPLKSKPSATPKRTIGDVVLGKGIECLGCGEILDAMFTPCNECGNDSHLSPNLTSRGTLVSREQSEPPTQPQQTV